MNKPVFIYSLHRSGSTYLMNIIGSSKEIKMLEDEVHFDHPFFFNTFRKRYNKICKDNYAKYDDFLRCLEEKPIRGAFWRHYKDIYGDFYQSKQYLPSSDDKITVWESFNSILRQVLTYSTKQRIGIKYPAHHKYFAEFINQYPESKNLFLLRDPRSIIASKLISPTNERLNNKGKIKYKILRLFTVLYFSFEFKSFIKTILNFNSKGIVVKYEDLVLYKEGTIKSLCDFCEIQMNEQMNHVNGKTSGYNQPNENEDRLMRWTTVLRRDEVLLVDLLTKKCRRSFGYD